MKTKTWFGVAMLVTTAVAAPVSAQMSPGSTQTTPAQPGSMQQTPPMQPDPMQPQSGTPSSMPSDTMPKMSASDQRKMQACQAMAPDEMMKDKRCAKMMEMHHGMMPGSPTPG